MADAGLPAKPSLPTDDDDPVHLSRFDRASEYLVLLDGFLADEDAPSSSDPAAKDKQLNQLRTILDEYQEQSYLLDPHLEAMVLPPVRILQAAVKGQGSQLRLDPRLQGIARLLYLYTKVRGYKTIVRFFPHEVADVVPTIAALGQFCGQAVSEDYDPSASWELRYILLLWLSLVCMIPFDLDRFGSSKGLGTADQIVSICKSYLDTPGKEREAAAVVLGNLFQRKDTSKTHLPMFVDWSAEQLSASSRPSPFRATGILQTLCEVVKLATPDIVVPLLPRIQRILSLGVYGEEDSETLQKLRANSLVNKYRSKLAARMGLKVLRPRRNGRGVVRRQLGGQAEVNSSMTPSLGSDADDADVPESIDGYIAQLLNGLQDKDTVVRYSAAKGLARICERLPGTFIDQVAEAVVDLFRINVLPVPTKTSKSEDGILTKSVEEDLSAVSEHTWQGACLALAEMVRRGLIAEVELSDKIAWVQKALFFDIRRGSHSIGTAVRDAACYVFWALARAYPPSAIRGHALVLAQKLITVACLDRDISIRRAASAAFQECVGRLGLFPHGIAVIGKTDFFSVGIRRTAFLVCTPAVAEYEEYRRELLRHLLNVTIHHWDPAMRLLGSQAVARVVALDRPILGPLVVRTLAPTAKSRDVCLLHGTLLTLGEVGGLFNDATSIRCDIFRLLDDLPNHFLTSTTSIAATPILSAACRVISSCVSTEALASNRWEQIIDAALAHRSEEVHEAAAQALAQVSKYQGCTKKVSSWLASWKKLTVAQKQSIALSLGAVRLHSLEKGSDLVERLLRFLVGLVDKGQPSTYSNHVETRRNACQSLSSNIVAGIGTPALKDHTLCRLGFEALLRGLEDYTMDQRGDVGSWIRLACMSGLRRIVDHYRTLYSAPAVSQAVTPLSDEGLDALLPEDLFHDAVAAIGRQMMQRIDHVRAEAAGHLLHLYRSASQDVGGTSFPRRPLGIDVVEAQFGPLSNSEEEVVSLEEDEKLRSATYLFPRTIHLLIIEQYRPALLSGLLQALNTKTDLSTSIVSKSLLDFALSETERYGPRDLLEDLVSIGEKQFASSQVAMPAMMAISILLEGGVFDDDEELATMALLERAHRLSVRSLDRIKSVARLTTTMQLCFDLFAIPRLRSQIVAVVPKFLAHPLPTIRSQAAEKLYLVLSSHLDDGIPEEAEELLLETAWGEKADGLEEAAKKMADALLEGIEGEDQ